MATTDFKISTRPDGGAGENYLNTYNVNIVHGKNKLTNYSKKKSFSDSSVNFMESATLTRNM